MEMSLKVAPQRCPYCHKEMKRFYPTWEEAGKIDYERYLGSFYFRCLNGCKYYAKSNIEMVVNLSKKISRNLC